MGVIFDLDMTLIDSSLAESFRNRRNWSNVYRVITQFHLYPGIIDSLWQLKQESIKICIVTSTPTIYCNKVLFEWKIPFDHTVCYHDTNNRKPHPEPIYKALSLLNLPANNVLSFGDRDVDVIASKSANVASVACTWGSLDRVSLLNSNPSYVLKNPIDLISLVHHFRYQLDNYRANRNV